MAKRKDEAELSNHSGSVAPEDPELTEWLNRLWARNEPPARVEVFQVFGQNGLTRGEMIHHEDFNPKDKRDVEHSNKLANEILAACQHDCDSKPRPKPTSYLLAIIDRNRTANPLTRRIGPVQPKRSLVLRTLNDIDAENDDEETLSLQALDLRRIKEANEQSRWDKQRNDNVSQGMLLLQHRIIENQQQTIDRFFDKVVMSFEKMQEAEDRRVQRDILLEKEKFKISLMRDGVRTARNLLPGLFAGATESSTTPAANGNGASNGHTNGSGNGNGAVPKDYGPSPERTLVINFIDDIEEEGEEINIALFGDFEERDGRMVQVKPGIFSFEQYRTLIGVHKGRLPIDALDNLMPKSGHALSITEEQIIKCGEAGVTEGIATAILELVGLRQRAREAREVAARDSSAPSTTPDPATVQ